MRGGGHSYAPQSYESAMPEASGGRHRDNRTSGLVRLCDRRVSRLHRASITTTTRVHAMSEGKRKIHRRIVIGGIILLVAFVSWIYFLDGITYFTGASR